MSPTGYTEDALIEQPAIALLAELGWQTICAYGEFDQGASSLGRETRAEVILKSPLRLALLRLNPEASPEAIHAAIEDLSRDRSRMSPAAANREVYQLLKNGVRVPMPDPEGEGETVELVRVIDWDDPANNDFLLCSQLWITGEMHTRRADLIGFVNGIPLLFIELKAVHRRLETAFNGNLRDYKDTVPQIFWPNALIILSNGGQSRVGSLTAGWEHFAEWKKVGSEAESGRVSLETMLRGVCDPVRFLDLVENFTLFQEVPGGLIKLTAKNHQYLGVNNALEALRVIRTRDGRLGVFWHTQGSGKSIAMLFFAQKVLRKLPGNWTFVIITDRQELDGQIYKHFASAGVVTEGRAQAQSSRHLRQLLSEDHRYVFTLIHKFRTEPGEAHPVLSPRRDIIVITDEAHRSQYDTLALNMRTALPNAAFLAFTGTPLIVGEEKTRQVFGDYISVYDFRQSVADGATVPLYYENRIPELQLTNDDLNADMELLLEAAELDPAQEAKLERELAREYHLITRDDRLEAVARDLVSHFIGRGFQGKAMMICIDKATAVRMYDKVKRHWAERLVAAQADLAGADEDSRREIGERIALLKETDMAVVVSQGQNEIAQIKDKGLDIRPHRKRTINEQLKGRVAQKLMAMVRLNRTRMDFLEEFQALIDAYNAGSLNAEAFFRQLVAFAQSLNEEERRGLGEQLDEEELALFDLLTKPQIDLSDGDRDKVKATARELLATLKAGKLVLDWRKRQQARAEVRVTIEKLLDLGLPRAYTPELFEEKASAVFQHVYDAYYGAARSVYAKAA